MENIKRPYNKQVAKRFNRGYILLESLLALALLTIITTLMLAEVTDSQKNSRLMNERIESLDVSSMALQTGQSNLMANGQSINISRNSQQLIIKDSQGKDLLQLEILEIQK